MAYRNHLLFNNIFLWRLAPSGDDAADARHFVHVSARDWYRAADFSTPARIAQSWVNVLLNQQSLDLLPDPAGDGNGWLIAAPWQRDLPLGYCYVAPHGADLDGYTANGALPKGEHWTIKAVEQARAVGDATLRWVIVTNGDCWRLVDARGLRRYEAYLEIDLLTLMQRPDDELAAYLFWRLFQLVDAFERDAADAPNKLDEFLAQSVHATATTEKYLKASVSDNLSTADGADGIMAQLCMGLVRAADPAGTYAFSAEERDAIYRDATYLLYRMLFILYAEARLLLPMQRDDYRRVSLQSMIDEALELNHTAQRNLETSTQLWEQLSSLFAAIHHSDEYLGIPPYDGGLFDDADKPYLRDYRIADLYLGEALRALAFTPASKTRETPERIDYRDLSVRHLGSLYEGMIEYKLFIAAEQMLARREKEGKVRYLKASQTTAQPNDELIPPGRVYFAQSPHERKATGTHYTTEDLVEKLVAQTVGRLLDSRWQTFQSQFQAWLDEIAATPDAATRARLQKYVDEQLERFVIDEVLSLRVGDTAMGSGHFLVHTAHVITNFIVHVLAQTPWASPNIDLAPDVWRRRVVERCLYGVDINGMAVELAKLSLWLVTMQVGRPLSFLDHHLKRGNSLLGARLDEILAVLAASDLNKQTRKTAATEAKGQLALRELPQAVQRLQEAQRWMGKLSDLTVASVEDVKEQVYDYAQAHALLAPYRQIGDLLVARKMGLKISDKDLQALAAAIEHERLASLSPKQRELVAAAKAKLDEEMPIHWELEFPGITLISPADRSQSRQAQFHVLLGNPPYLGGAKISTTLGDSFLRFLKSNYAESGQNTDLCAYFVRMDYDLVSLGGYVGLVTTNTISQGDSREGGLASAIAEGGVITDATRFIKWSGDATIEVNLLVVCRSCTGQEPIKPTLDGLEVTRISSWLDDLVEDHPLVLQNNRGKSFLGAVIHGTGFLLNAEQVDLLTKKNPKNKEKIFNYLVGRDVNDDPLHLASRQVINFGDQKLDDAEQYPDLIAVIRKHVKPYRDTVKRKQYREKWWLFAEYCVELRKVIPKLHRVLVRSRVSELHMLAFVDTDQVLSDATVVFAYDDFYNFSLLQSYMHEVWLRRQASSMRTDIRYTPTDCFRTFPFPQTPDQDYIAAAAAAGERYYTHRQQFMVQHNLGMTKTYNLFHDPGVTDAEIEMLRTLHAAMDEAVLACYGWEDIDLAHGFYPNDRKKTRFMPARAAQRDLFTRLMALNHAIAAEEAAAGVTPADEEDDTGDDDDEL